MHLERLRQRRVLEVLARYVLAWVNRSLAAYRSFSRAPSINPNAVGSLEVVPLTGSQEALRPIARERIAKRQLPHQAPKKMLRGYGTGQLCSLCDKPIPPREVEYRIEHILAAVPTFRFHMVCLLAWQLECARDDYSKKHS